MADTALPTFVAHLECSATGDRFEPDAVRGLSAAGKPLLVRYDLDGVAGSVTTQDLAAQPPGMWRCREFLPVRRAESVISPGEPVPWTWK